MVDKKTMLFAVPLWAQGEGIGKRMSLGIFASSADVGAVRHAGSAAFEASTDTYTVWGSGKNIWQDQDAFHFAWTEATGDVSLGADIVFPNPGVDPHRKAVLMIRQSLDADSVYVDATLHGDGLTSLQFRESAGVYTHQVQSHVSGPRRLRIEKRGGYILLFVGGEAEELAFSGAAIRIAFPEPFYVGIGVCSHNEDVVETAVFSEVQLKTTLSPLNEPTVLHSTLETQNMASTDRRVVYTAPTHIEAPNWRTDGKTLIVNRGGRLLQIPVAGGELETIDTGFAVGCNNDHGVSPDGIQLVISDRTETGKSLIYTLPVGGGTPQKITETGPSYWHGWSPDGETHTFCGQRDGKYGIFTIPADGTGAETRLTITDGLDDGPEYSHDGRYIYFNSDRTGQMQIWRINADGSDSTQITDDEYGNWFAHPSPDGRFLVILSYEKEVAGHPADKDVTLRRMTLATGEISVLARLFGGQGTINVPCWSPDSKQIAFVTYQRL